MKKALLIVAIVVTAFSTIWASTNTGKKNGKKKAKATVTIKKGTYVISNSDSTFTRLASDSGLDEMMPAGYTLVTKPQ